MRWLRNDAVVAGLVAGVVGLGLSFAVRLIVPGRLLADPLPLALSAGQLTRGFLYFNWRAPLSHVLFAILLGFLAVLTLRYFSKDRIVTNRDVLAAARITAVLNVGVVALREVDALIVGFWYLLAGWISVFVTSQAAVWVHRGIKRKTQER